jgi:hypothetical protein
MRDGQFATCGAMRQAATSIVVEGGERHPARAVGALESLRVTLRGAIDYASLVAALLGIVQGGYVELEQLEAGLERHGCVARRRPFHLVFLRMDRAAPLIPRY